ncbi:MULTISPECIES: phage terminase large subunit [unclassified Vibrio]|uniref:phage terminase large subunit n=1 Tax=unclassified Vibrio TaxID=2614977 RepID=UPI001361CF55|nr:MULTISPECIES: phage terminase large subunit [unclassified Vibrio]NAW59313.1 phage terminase large subunit [Vibrio sp. V36_P2S2PM302]NAX24995.1 phage terminase large subunit [Vibrio sp. V38_P2S17PM301]NAX29218.1 phage terminase large subunit [Vibrio sp. V37_P2S8PM304]
MSGLFEGVSDADLENIRDSAHIAVEDKRLAKHSKAQEARALARQEKEEKARQKRRAKSKHDFAYFCKTYMPDAFTLAFSEYQLALTRLAANRNLNRQDEVLFKELIDPRDHGFIQQPISGEYEGILDIEPRDHGKTTRNTQAMPLWLALNHPGSFIVICGASADSAKEMMDAIKDDLEDNELILDDYGEQRGNTWTKRKIKLANGSSIVAVGRGQRLRGIKNKYQRPTHIICDDLLDDKEVESPTLRRQAERWFKRVIMNLGKGALTIIANTIMHPDDLPSRLLNQIEEGRLPNWLGLRFSAITPSGRPLFPSRWSLQDLENKRIASGSAWWTEWMNRPIADEDADFKEDWFVYFKPYELDLRDCTLGMAVDPATGLKKGDWSFIAVVARHKITMVDHVLFAKGWKESDLQFAQRIVDVYLQHRPSFVMFETVAFQKIYKKEVMRYAKKKGVRLPVREFKGGNKQVRIKSLSSQVENGLIQFLETQTLLRQMFLEFPRGHDDGPDAVEMAISGFDSGFVGGAVPQTPRPIRTAAQALSRFGGGALSRILR